ncbi:MAG: response regulator transcription factor [Bifidobacteriaceae bacterium]|jgi:DNA-binding response OmpR family regulator|nr:response regulator transcription factor [Bifidobacteriaceae bacterium]
MRLLVVEDEEVLLDAIVRGLRRAGHAVDAALDGDQAMEMTAITPYDVIVLDRDLPIVHGDEVCARLGGAGYPARILMLTAAARIDDRVAGLNLGSDDYLTKPFAFRELLARVAALGRRAVPAQAKTVIVGELQIDTARRSVRRAGRTIPMTPKQFGVLEALAREPGTWRSAEWLLDKVWDAHADPFTSAVRVTVARLRAKLGEPAVIETERGVGYRVMEP